MLVILKEVAPLWSNVFESICNYDILYLECRFSVIVYSKAVPSRKSWRRPLMVRQPYSVAVLSTEKGGYILPSEEEGLVRGGAPFG